MPGREITRRHDRALGAQVVNKTAIDDQRRRVLKHLAAVLPLQLTGCVLYGDHSGSTSEGSSVARSSSVGVSPVAGEVSPGARSNASAPVPQTGAATTATAVAPTPIQVPPSTVTFRRTAAPANGIPAWMASAPLGAWSEIPEGMFFNGAAWNYLKQRYFDSRILRGSGPEQMGAYSGGVLNLEGAHDKDGNWLPGPIYVRWGGGHFATDCNAVIGLHLNTDLPQWYVLSEPRAPGLGTPDDASYAAGDRGFYDSATQQPISPHTYDFCQYDQATNRMVVPMLIAAGMVGRHAATAVAYSFGQAGPTRWQLLAENHSQLSYSPWCQVAFIKPNTRTLYFSDHQALIWRRRMDLNTNAVTSISTSAANDRVTGNEGLTTCYDPVSDVALYIATGNARMYAISSADFERPGVAGWEVSANLAGASIPAGASTAFNALAFDAAESCWYYWTNAEPSVLRKITRPQGGYRGTWNSQMISGTNSASPVGPDVFGQQQHMYNAMRVVQIGGVRGVMLGRSLGDHIRFFRLA